MPSIAHHQRLPHEATSEAPFAGIDIEIESKFQSNFRLPILYIPVKVAPPCFGDARRGDDVIDRSHRFSDLRAGAEPTLAHVQELAGELRAIVANLGLPMLVYLMEMVIIELEDTIARQRAASADADAELGRAID